MDALDTQCYEEYYIACNPPLTLFGVDEVISKSGVYLQVSFIFTMASMPGAHD